jgi:hypothetical protein
MLLISFDYKFIETLYRFRFVEKLKVTFKKISVALEPIRVGRVAPPCKYIWKLNTVRPLDAVNYYYSLVK